MADDDFLIYASKKLETYNEIKSLNNRLSIKFIEPQKELSITSFALLILDKKSEGLYSDIRYRSESQFDTIAFFDKDRNNAEDIINAISTLKELLCKPGVLNQSQIKNLTSLDILIYDPNPSNIESASYDLSLSSEHFISGINFTQDRKIDIAPLDFVIVRAKESANIPSNICGTFDLRVNMFCRGIILSNGPQIDPGYMGRFLCLLYNASSQNYIMEEDKAFCTVVFQSLSSASKRYTGGYQRKKSIQDYVTPYATTTISTNIQRIEEIRKGQERLDDKNESQQKRIDSYKKNTEALEKRISSIEGKMPWFSSFIGLILGGLSIVISFFIAYIFNDLNRDVGYYKSETIKLKEERVILKNEITKIEKLLESNGLRLEDIAPSQNEANHEDDHIVKDEKKAAEGQSKRKDALKN